MQKKIDKLRLKLKKCQTFIEPFRWSVNIGIGAIVQLSTVAELDKIKGQTIRLTEFQMRNPICEYKCETDKKTCP